MRDWLLWSAGTFCLLALSAWPSRLRDYRSDAVQLGGPSARRAFVVTRFAASAILDALFVLLAIRAVTPWRGPYQVMGFTNVVLMLAAGAGSVYARVLLGRWWARPSHRGTAR